jgi:hypothetical protein
MTTIADWLKVLIDDTRTTLALAIFFGMTLR